jgi:hypothetical protein
MSIFRRLQELARDGVPLDEAERVLRADQRRRKPARSPGERHAAEKRGRAEELGLAESHEAAQAARLTAWMGWDIAPPPEGDE